MDVQRFFILRLSGPLFRTFSPSQGETWKNFQQWAQPPLVVTIFSEFLFCETKLSKREILKKFSFRKPVTAYLIRGRARTYIDMVRNFEWTGYFDFGETLCQRVLQ